MAPSKKSPREALSSLRDALSTGRASADNLDAALRVVIALESGSKFSLNDFERVLAASRDASGGELSVDAATAGLSLARDVCEALDASSAKLKKIFDIISILNVRGNASLESFIELLRENALRKGLGKKVASPTSIASEFEADFRSSPPIREELTAVYERFLKSKSSAMIWKELAKRLSGRTVKSVDEAKKAIHRWIVESSDWRPISESVHDAIRKGY